MSETKKRNVKVVESKTLSSRYDRRFVIVDEETENVLDDAQGYGYKSKQKAKIVFNYISSYQAVQQSDFSKNFPLNGIHPNFFASFFLLITVRLDICSSSAICATVNPL